MNVKKLSALFLSLVMVAACMFATTSVSAEGSDLTLVNAYVRLDNEMKSYDGDTAAYEMRAQAYLKVAEECYDTKNGVADRLSREPSVVAPEGMKVFWYEIVQENGKWRMHGVFVSDLTLVNAYVRLDNEMKPYDGDTAAYEMRAQAYLKVAEGCYDTENGVADRLSREPSVVTPEGMKVFWYEIVQENGKWRMHGVFVPLEEAGETVAMGIVTPKKMSVQFEDGKIYRSGDTLKIEIGETYRFRMCSNNWENDTYDDNGNGLAGTVVYSVRVSNRYDERSYDEETKTFVLPKGDPVLRTDINSCFMAYRYHFTKGDYNKQTGIQQVVEPTESLSVNLPLGSTIQSDAYKAFNQIDTKNVFIERGEDLTLSYTDYYWEY